MTRYAVTFYETIALTFYVEAASKADAVDRARDRCDQGGEPDDEETLGTEDTVNVEEMKP